MITVFWFRRDLRTEDNTAFYHALKSGKPVLPLFIFDPEILDELPKNDGRVTFIHQQLQKLQQQFAEYKSGLLIEYGKPKTIWKKLANQYDIAEVFWNKDYEPYARKRDGEISDFLQTNNIKVNTYKDQVIFEEDEILKKDGTCYTVFTPYFKRWWQRFSADGLPSENSPQLENLLQHQTKLLTLKTIGFSPSTLKVSPFCFDHLDRYEACRDFPALDCTSHLSVHLRFGTVSIRSILRKVGHYEKFVSELAWREFYMQILWHFPHVVHRNFKAQYDDVKWRKNNEDLERWKNGTTGYPMVDAGMRELNTTGHMHNRVRMVTASFLCKHLLINWQEGESYFAEKLLDFELASNNGNWQWAAGTGCDAAPYFRVFNPTSQLEKFDKNLEYVKKWIPEFGTHKYPAPMVDHAFARQRALDTYKEGLGKT